MRRKITTTCAFLASQAVSAAITPRRIPAACGPHAHVCDQRALTLYALRRPHTSLLRAGFPVAKLAELHGNIYIERCERCNASYTRDFEVAAADAPAHHRTDRTCDAAGCGGRLLDNIVHFHEALPWGALTMANAKFVGADMTVVLGSSLSVEPAAGLAFKAKRRRRAVAGQVPVRAVIVNLQPTPRDGEADLVIHARCDEVLEAVARALLPGWGGEGGGPAKKQKR